MDLDRWGFKREWADLPDEMLGEISSHLFATDVQSFSLVCRSWYKAVKASFYRLLPCLMFYLRSKRMWKVYQHDRFFYMSIPELDSAHICSSKHGWLLMSRNDRTLFFFDPFNGLKIEVPGARDDDYTTIHFFNKPSSLECFIVGIKNHDIDSENTVKIGVLKRGKNSWESFVCRSDDPFTVSLSAPVLRGGMLYFLDARGNVATLDVDRVESSWAVHTSCFPFRKLRGKIRQYFLFKIEDQDYLFAVFMIHDNENINLFRLSEEEDGEMEWEFVLFISNRALYLSQGCSFGHVVDFSIKANCIFLPKFKHESDEIVLYNLQSERYHHYSFDYRIKYPFRGLRGLDAGVTWILPALPTHDQLPTWS